MSARSRLATLNEKVTTLERRVDYIEARVSITEDRLTFLSFSDWAMSLYYTASRNCATIHCYL